MKKLTYDSKEHPSRLDAFISAKEGISRQVARSMIDAGEVSVNGKKSRSGARLAIGDEVQLDRQHVPARVRPELVNLEKQILPVVFEDEHLVVIEKPRGMDSVVHRIEDPITVADILSKQFPETATASEDIRESGLVHRLDYSTSGLLIAAKTKEAWHLLHESLFKEELEKSYIALVEGVLEKEELIDAMICMPRNSPKVFVEWGEGPHYVEAQTEVKSVSEFEKNGMRYSFVQANASRARRHQIRAHLAHITHPLVGDELYGATTKLSEVHESLKNGFFLHASSIEFVHPVTEKRVRVESDYKKFS